MNVRFVNLRAQRRSPIDDMEQSVCGVLVRDDSILGEGVRLSEGKLVAYCVAEYSVDVYSGTSTPQLSLRASNICPGEEVIATANTFVAAAFAVPHNGTTPTLVDGQQVRQGLVTAGGQA